MCSVRNRFGWLHWWRRHTFYFDNENSLFSTTHIHMPYVDRLMNSVQWIIWFNLWLGATSNHCQKVFISFGAEMESDRFWICILDELFENTKWKVFLDVKSNYGWRHSRFLWKNQRLLNFFRWCDVIGAKNHAIAMASITHIYSFKSAFNNHLFSFFVHVFGTFKIIVLSCCQVIGR